ncbi:hypothetical protein ANO11243_038150 [Dothideomycetidae sp. 11243]|nr:hypothetical protein ANO11243_038150 [fungal sp. No.11243]
MKGEALKRVRITTRLVDSTAWPDDCGASAMAKLRLTRDGGRPARCWALGAGFRSGTGGGVQRAARWVASPGAKV